MEPGQYQREGQRIRMKAQLEKLQAEISTISRKTGITSATQLAKLVPKTDTKSSEPDVEWWDALIMVNGHSSKYVIGKLNLNFAGELELGGYLSIHFLEKLANWPAFACPTGRVLGLGHFVLEGHNFPLQKKYLFLIVHGFR